MRVVTRTAKRAPEAIAPTLAKSLTGGNGKALAQMACTECHDLLSIHRSALQPRGMGHAREEHGGLGREHQARGHSRAGRLSRREIPAEDRE